MLLPREPLLLLLPPTGGGQGDRTRANGVRGETYIRMFIHTKLSIICAKVIWEMKTAVPALFLFLLLKCFFTFIIEGNNINYFFLKKG